MVGGRMKKKLPLIDGVEPACERCAFCDDYGENQGQCRRYPPHRAVDELSDEDVLGTEDYEWQFPIVDYRGPDWCGEFRKAEYEEEVTP